MCEKKTDLVSVCLILLVRASFCMYWVCPEKNVVQNSGIKIKNLCESGYKKYCLNGGECYYLINEDTVDTVIVHGFLEENVVKNKCDGLR